MPPFEAALKGAREIGFTIISITFSLIAVFIPVLLMGGIVGRVFREFAITIAVAIMVSGFVSLTLTPMLCARVLKAHDADQETEYRTAAVRADVRFLAAGLRMVARLGARPQGDDAGGDAGDAGRHRRALYRRAQGILSPGRHRLSVRYHGGRDRYVVRGHDGAPEGAGRHSQQGSGGRIHQQHGRSRRAEHHHELCAAVHRAEAEEGAGSRAGGDGASAPEGHPGAGDAGVLPERPEPQHRRSAVQEPVPVLPAERRHGMRSTGSRRKCATGSPRCPGCSTSPPISTSKIRR